MKIITTLLFLITGALTIFGQKPMASVNGSTALTTDTVHALDDAVISLEVYPNSESWLWMGPEGYLTTGAAVLLSDFTAEKAGLYTAASTIEGDDTVIDFSLIHLQEDFADNDVAYYTCGTDLVTISTGTSGLIYSWDNGMTTPTIDVDGLASPYGVTVSTIFGDTDTADISVVNTQDATINISLTPVTCHNILEVTAPVGAETYVWSDGQIGPSALVDLFAIGQISVDMTTASGCQSTFMYNIDKSDVSIELENIQVEGFCSGADLDLIAPGGYDSYTWDNGTTGPVNTIISTHNNQSYVDMVDNEGCLTRRYMTVIITSAVTAQMSYSNPTDCSQLGSVSLSLENVTVTDLPLTATVYGENNFSQQFILDSITNELPLPAGAYNVIDIQTLDGCNFSLDGFFIDYYYGLEEETNMPEVTICSGDELVLEVVGNYNTAIWSDASTGGSITISPSETSLYSVDLYLSTGCSQRFYYPVTVLDSPEAEVTVMDSEGSVDGSVAIKLTQYHADMFPISVTAVGLTGQDTEIGVMFSDSINIQLEEGEYNNLMLVPADYCSLELGDFEIEYIPTYTTIDMGIAEVCTGSMMQLSAPYTEGATYLWNDGTASMSNSILISGSISISVESTDNQGNVINYVYSVLTTESTMATLYVNNRVSNVLGSIDIEIDNPSPDMFPIEVYATDVVSGVALSIATMTSSTMNIQLSDNSYENLQLINASNCVTSLGDFEITYQPNNAERRVEGKVWLDVLSEAGILENEEPGLEGIVVRAINTEGDIKAEVVTDAEGSYVMNVDKEDVYIEFHSTYNLAVTIPDQGGDNSIGSDVDGSNGPGTTDIISVDGNVNINAGFVHGVLSIDWNDISVVRQDDDHLLTWNVTGEESLSHYEIERSIGGLTDFNFLGDVGLSDNDQSQKTYDFVDDSVDQQEIYYYRIKQVDMDGVYSYSKIVSIQADNDRENSVDIGLVIYPIPAHDDLNIEIKSKFSAEEIIVDVYTLTGTLVKTQSIKTLRDIQNQKLELNISELETGLYILNLTIDKQLISSKIVVE